MIPSFQASRWHGKFTLSSKICWLEKAEMRNSNVIQFRVKARRLRFQYELDRTKIVALSILMYINFGILIALLNAPATLNNMLLITLAITATLSLFLFIMLKITMLKSANYTQNDRNKFANRLISEGSGTYNHEFSLYLRPFILDNEINISPDIRSDEIFSSFLMTNFENCVAQAVDKTHPIVSLGTERASFGPGASSTHDDRWKDVILDLMEHASLIIVVPIIQPATMWEIQQIFIKNYLSKTVFIVPPYKFLSLSDRNKLPGQILDSIYRSGIEKLHRVGINLPFVNSNGGLFWLHSPNLWRVRYFKKREHFSYLTVRNAIFQSRFSEISEAEEYFSLEDATPT